MKIKWGALVTDGRNKIGGHVASRNGAGAYIRTKVTPLNPNSESQSGVRASFSGRAQAWRGLTEAQRLTWIGAVLNFVSTDIFGDKITPSGFQLYMKLNSNITAIAESVLTDAPTPASVFSFTTFSATYTIDTHVLTAIFTAAIPATDKVIISATAGVSVGKKFVKSEYRQIGVMDDSDTTPFDFTALYTAKFGAIPAVGLKIFVKVKPVCIATGQSGLARSSSAVIIADTP